MTRKHKTTKPAAAKDPGTVLVPEQPGKTRERILADMAAAGRLANAHVMATFAKPAMGELSIGECMNALRDTSQAINGGDLSGAEAMLAAQAASLNAIFAETARRAAANMGEYLGATETYLRLALKAQAQCRATLETLAEIKNPPTVFARQANIAHGPQQVNNGVPAPAAPRADETDSMQTELLGASDGERLDTGKTNTGGRGNPALETVGTINRADDRRG
ncbi:MAG: hypothetical protein M9951_03935 [Burkholderiaceae bacterium]|nr:hypothetical protein [Burkholderiaceae bacterium]